MSFDVRAWFPYAMIALLLAALTWAASFGTLPPADFTFGNGTEIKTVDPALVTGQPEGRIIYAISECLCGLDPKTLEPIPGTAESWEISEDGRTYTFHIRQTARWSDNSPVTAEDFVFSYHRFLHPETASEYAYQLWYVVNAERFSKGQIKIGERVDVELNDRPNEGQLYPSGTILKGTLDDVVVVKGKKTDDDGFASREPGAVYVVNVNGKQRRFSKEGGEGTEKIAQLMLDADLVGMRALDERTLEFKLTNPTPFFLKLMTFYPLSPVNRRCVETYGYPLWTKPENIVSNGPFVLEFRRIRDRIRLRRSATYWNRDNIQLETIDALAVSSTPTMLNLYLTGQLDWCTTVPSAIIPELKQRDDFHSQAFLGTYYYRINVDRPGLKDPRVRQALNMATDKQDIIDRVTKGGQIPARSFVPPGIAGYTPALCGAYDVEAAKRLLAEAGYPDGKGLPTIEILYNTLEGHQKIAEVLQQQWRANLGIDVRLVNQEWAVYLASTRKQEYWLSRAGWIGDYADPNTFLDMYVTNGANNQTGWGNRDYDRLIADAAKEEDPAKRMAILRQAEEILMQELPMLPLYYYVSAQMIRPYVEGLYPNILDTHPYQAIRVDAEQKRQFLTSEGLR